MKKLANYALLGSAALVLASCGSSDDASTEAMPETVEIPADEALGPIAEEPVVDEEALGPPPAPVDPAANAPDPVTTEQVADDAAAIAAEAVAAAEAADAAAAAIPVVE